MNSQNNTTLKKLDQYETSLVKDLVVYRFLNSQEKIDTDVINFWKNKLNIFKPLNQKKIEEMVDILFEINSTPSFGHGKYLFPESSIVVVMTRYFWYKLNYEDNNLIFELLDKERNQFINQGLILDSFSDHELNITNYLLHMMENEDPESFIKMNIQITKEQIEIIKKREREITNTRNRIVKNQ